MIISFSRAWVGHPVAVASGAAVSCELPAGCSFHRSDDGAQTWYVQAVPFVADCACFVRVDCDVYAGPGPLVATLHIEQ